VLHSQAHIDKARRLLHYAPAFRIQEGIDATVPWYVQKIAASPGVDELGRPITMGG
jgi:nucleoside-diphosphate-sugar epimerase